ncbi:MAG: PC4/YdbC family ssDNA-binding protein [Pseudomonadota bacterium]
MTAPLIVANLRKDSRERVRVALDQWQGHDLLDIRVTAQLTEATDVWCPTKKGLSVNVAMIPALRLALADAEAQARKLGLLDG